MTLRSAFRLNHSRSEEAVVGRGTLTAAQSQAGEQVGDSRGGWTRILVALVQHLEREAGLQGLERFGADVRALDFGRGHAGGGGSDAHGHGLRVPGGTHPMCQARR